MKSLGEEKQKLAEENAKHIETIKIIYIYIKGIQNENSKLVETIKDLESDVQKSLEEKEKCEGKISRLSLMIH